MERDHDEASPEWKRLSKAFFRRPAPPTPIRTEAFTARVMSRLAEREASPFAAAFARWLAPALGVGFAALAFSFSPYARDAGVDPAAVIASADRPGLPAWLSSPGASVADDLYALDAEDR